MVKHVIVSVHDWAPNYYEELVAIVKGLDQLAIQERAHLVVPYFAKKYHLANANAFNELVMEEREKGSEISLHGIHHNYAEFYRANYDTAKAYISEGLQIFTDAYGFVPPGFVAPQWVQSQGSLRAVYEAQFKYTETLRAFRPRDKKMVHAYPLNYDWGIVMLDYMMSRCNARSIAHYSNDLLRFAIHPMDVRNGLFPVIMNHLDQIKRLGAEFITAERYTDEVAVL